jgi:hypothetical protein
MEHVDLMRTSAEVADAPITDLVRLRRLADEQAALRRVVTLVAEGVQSQEFFAVVAAEVALVIDVPLVWVVRYGSDNAATQCASFSAALHGVPIRESLEHDQATFGLKHCTRKS